MTRDYIRWLIGPFCRREGDMFRKISLIVIASLFILGMSKLSLAMMCGDHSQHIQLAQAHGEQEYSATETNKESVLEEAVNVGNKTCPVTGEKIDEKTMAAHEYEGKIYNFCCPDCIKEFKKDPEKYIKKVNEELKNESEAGSKEHMMMPESGMPEG